MAKIFSKFGAKRSENLSDLASTVTALNTLLDRIKGSAESFTGEDLQLIKGIFSSDVDSNVFSRAANTTVQFTGPTGTNITYEPLITLSNRFDRAYFTTSEPFFFGGDGLTARYFNSDGILRSTPEDASTPFLGFDNYVDPADPTGRATIDPARGTERADDKNNFWEEGEFVYNQKLSPNLANFYGGVEWTGFFKPTQNGTWSIRITTTGFIRVEFDTKEAPSKDFTFDPSTGTFRLNDLDFNNGSGLQTILDQTRLVTAGIIDEISTAGAAVPAEFNQNYGTITAFTYSGVDGVGASFNVNRDLGGNPIVIINNPGDGYLSGETITIPGASVGGADITITIDNTRGWYFYDELGASNTGIALGTSRTFQVNLGELKAYDPYKIKISFFYDDDAIDKSESQITGSLDRRIIFQRNSPLGGQDDDFDYKYLYPEDYFDFYQIGNFKKFIDESISFAGTRINDRLPIGIQTTPLEGAAGDNYVGLSNFNPIVSYYVGNLGPVTDIIQAREATTTNNSRIVVIPDSGINTGLPNRTEFVEVGNYVIGAGIPIGSRVSGINNNQSIILDRTCTSSGTSNIEIIDHKGLVAFGTNGQYSTNIVPTTGLVEDGFSLGSRGFDVPRIISGDTVDLDFTNTDYGTFEQGVNITSNTDGTGATFNISRNNNGSFVITTLTPGTGYSNFELFEIDGNLLNQPGINLVFDCATLTDTFLTGKPRLIFQKNQIFKQEEWTGQFFYNDKTIPGQEEVGVLKQSSQTALIDRFQTGIESGFNQAENSFVFADQSLGLSGSNFKKWFVYQTFGLNNDGLASYCQGVFDKRILPKLELNSGGSGYVSEALPGLPGSSVGTTGGTGSNLQVYYVTDGAGAVTYAWVDPDNAGEGYEPGNTITIAAGNNDATFTLDYPDVASSSVTFRVPDAKDLTNGMVAHLFPSLQFTGPDVNNLGGVATISNIVSDITQSASNAGGGAQDTAALVTLTVGSGAVQNNPISFVDSVVTRITFTPVGDTVNKEVCFRPTDTSPPFAATSRGLATINDVKMVLDFTSTGGGRAGVFNTNSKVSYDKLEMVTDGSNEVATDANDIMGGYVPITDGNGDTYYLLLWRDNA